MLKHIVMWTIKDSVNKEETAKKIKRMLEELAEKIEVIKEIEVGININSSASAYDVVLYSEFKNAEALNEYQKHPEHLKVAEFIVSVVEKRAVVDYEI